MFTEQQIKAAHSKVKTGADFPQYIQEIKTLGLTRYEFLVTNGSMVYFGENGYEINSAPKYKSMTINADPYATQLQHTISIHQKGQTDFLTFCRQAAKVGVEKWVVDTQKMMCTYYDLKGAAIVAEPIPQGNY